MKMSRKGRARRYALMLAAALSGGTTVSSCDTRVRQDFVDGTKAWVFSLFDAGAILDAFTPDTIIDVSTQ